MIFYFVYSFLFYIHGLSGFSHCLFYFYFFNFSSSSHLPLLFPPVSFSDKNEKALAMIFKENVRFTTPIQQLYNNSSHEGGFYILGPTLM
jgi:hypothetical protein